jgi:hypothetical protein
MDTKSCRVCQKELSIIEFYKRSASKDGYDNRCKKCTLNYDIQRSLNHAGPAQSGSKICSRCKSTKDVSEFTKRLRSKDGLRDRCRQCDRSEERQYRLKHPSKNKFRKIKAKYGMDIDTYTSMLQKQNYQCCICKQVLKLEVDHSHKNGKVRGLLCHACNVGIGFFSDNIDYLKKAIEYLTNNE